MALKAIQRSSGHWFKERGHVYYVFDRFHVYYVFDTFFCSKSPEIESVYKNLDHNTSRYSHLPQNTNVFLKKFDCLRPEFAKL